MSSLVDAKTTRVRENEDGSYNWRITGKAGDSMILRAPVPGEKVYSPPIKKVEPVKIKKIELVIPIKYNTKKINYFWEK